MNSPSVPPHHPSNRHEFLEIIAKWAAIYADEAERQDGQAFWRETVTNEQQAMLDFGAWLQDRAESLGEDHA